MSKIAFFLKDAGTQKAAVAGALHAGLGVALRDALKADDEVPLVEASLFDRRDPEFAKRLLEVMKKLESLGASVLVYQLLDDQKYSSKERYYQLTINRLTNLISSREESLRHLRDLGEE